MVFLKKNPYQCFFLSLPLFSPYSLSLSPPPIFPFTCSSIHRLWSSRVWCFLHSTHVRACWGWIRLWVSPYPSVLIPKGGVTSFLVSEDERQGQLKEMLCSDSICWSCFCFPTWSLKPCSFSLQTYNGYLLKKTCHNEGGPSSHQLAAPWLFFFKWSLSLRAC